MSDETILGVQRVQALPGARLGCAEGTRGTYTAGNREIVYWSHCETCKERKTCKHTCDHPGWMRFLVDGQRSVWWSGIITQRKIDQTVIDYLENDPPGDVSYPLEKMEQMEMNL